MKSTAKWVLVCVASLAQAVLAQEPAPSSEGTEGAAAEKTAGKHPLSVSSDSVVEYTDNRDGEPVKASTLDLYERPRVDLMLDSQRGILDAYFAPAVRLRTNPAPDRDAIEFFYDLGIDARLRATSRIVLGLSDSLNQSDDPSVLRDETRLRRDSQYLVNRAAAEATLKLSRKSEIDLDARHSAKRYARSAISTIGNEDSLVGGLSCWYRMTPGIGLAVLGRLERFDYPQNGDINRDFDSAMGGLGAEYKMAKSLVGTGTLGWKGLAFSDAELGAQAGPYARLALRGSVTPAVRLTAAASRQIRDSDVYPYAAQQYTGVETTMEWDVLKELMLSAVGAYRFGEYDSSTLPRAFLNQPQVGQGNVAEGGEAVATGSVTGGEEEVLILEAQVKYNIGHGKALRAYQRREQVDTDLGDSFDRNSTGLAFTMQF